MSATGVTRVAPTGSKASPNVRYAFNGDRICASQRTDAMCHLGDSRVRAGRGIWISRERYHVTRRPTLPFRAMSDSPLTPLK